MHITFRFEDEHLLDQNDIIGCMDGRLLIHIQDEQDQRMEITSYTVYNSAFHLFSIFSILEHSGGTLIFDDEGTVYNYHFHLKDDLLTMELVLTFPADDIPPQRGVFVFSRFKPAFTEAFQQYLATLAQRNPLITEHPNFRCMTRCSISKEWLECVSVVFTSKFIELGREVPPFLEFFKRQFRHRPDES